MDRSSDSIITTPQSQMEEGDDPYNRFTQLALKLPQIQIDSKGKRDATHEPSSPAKYSIRTLPSRRNSPAISLLQREQVQHHHHRGPLATPRRPAPSVLSSGEEDATKEIIKMLTDNKVDDLAQFLVRRSCLNKANMFLIYIFHLFQNAGIVFIAISANVKDSQRQQFIIIGLLCQIAASMLSTYQHVNESISETIMKDIIAIKDNTYGDEGVIVNDETY